MIPMKEISRILEPGQPLGLPGFRASRIIRPGLVVDMAPVVELTEPLTLISIGDNEPSETVSAKGSKESVDETETMTLIDIGDSEPSETVNAKTGGKESASETETMTAIDLSANEPVATVELVPE